MRSASCVCGHVVLVGGRKKFMGSHESNMYRLYIYWSLFFLVFQKFKRGIPALGAMTMPVNICFEFIVLSFLCWLEIWMVDFLFVLQQSSGCVLN